MDMVGGYTITKASNLPIHMFQYFTVVMFGIWDVIEGALEILWGINFPRQLIEMMFSIQFVDRSK